MDVAERQLFAAALRKGIETADTVDRELEAIGWTEALSDDRPTAVSTLFELQGECNATSSALDAGVATASGLAGGRIVLPALGGYAAPATGEERIHVRGLCRGRINGGDVHVVAPTADAFMAIRVVADDLRVRDVEGMDPAIELVEITAEVAPSQGLPVDWAAGVAAGQQALAHELVGTARAMLRLAREHAVERVQFGRPIGSFQAVRHRLADALVAVEAAQSAADATWCAPETSALAKAVAGRSARIVARHAQQVLAGIGFTTEHPLHRYVRRALVLDALFGSSRMLARELGDEALRTRQLPRPIPL
jgi:hypothetical protein